MKPKWKKATEEKLTCTNKNEWNGWKRKYLEEMEAINDK